MKDYRHHRLWNSIYTGGAILAALLSAAAVLYIPFSYQWLNSLICAVTCFLCVWLYSRHSDASQSGKMLSRILLLMAITELILGVLFLRVITQAYTISMWMKGFIFLSPVAYTFAYRLLFMVIFPQAEKSNQLPAPDPLAQFPQSVQEIMRQGRKQVNNPVAFTMLACTLLGAITYLMSIFISGEGQPYLFIVPAALGYLLGFMIAFILARKWQRWARRSGISEQELKAAARAAHLWWPKTRGDIELERPRKFPG